MKQTVPNKYLLPLIPELIDKLKGAKIFMKLNLQWGYNNVWIKEEDRFKQCSLQMETLGTNHHVFGLQNSPATFQSMMNALFDDLIKEGWVIIYMTYPNLFKRPEEHRILVKKVLQQLEEEDLFLKPEKCSSRSHLLNISAWSLAKIKFKWILPSSQQYLTGQVQSVSKTYNLFLGSEIFISDSSKDLHISQHHLHRWLRRTPHGIGTMINRSIQYTQTTVHFGTNPPHAWLLETISVRDGCFSYDYGAILSQQSDDGHWLPVAYMSKQILPAEHNYVIYNKELPCHHWSPETLVPLSRRQSTSGQDLVWSQEPWVFPYSAIS